MGLLGERARCLAETNLGQQAEGVSSYEDRVGELPVTEWTYDKVLFLNS